MALPATSRATPAPLWVPSRPHAWWPAALVAACVALLPFGRTVELAVAVMAVLGVAMCVRNRRRLLADPAVRLFSLCFLSVWVPILASLPDAVNPERTLVVAVNHWRFYFAGVFVIGALAAASQHRLALRIAAWVLLLWVADAMVQLALGVDLLGHEAHPTRLNALFGDRNPKFGIMLALLSPLLWQWARDAWPRPVQAAVALALVLVVLVAGTRSSWVMLAAVIAAYLALELATRRLAPWRAAAAAAALLAFGVLLFHTSERFEARLSHAVSGFTEGMHDRNPVSHRLWIWKGALAMIEAHPVNGVGARGFRYAYREHASAGDPFVEKRAIPVTHSHQLVLEIGAETGLIGLAGLALLVACLARAAVRAAAWPEARLMLPYGIALGAAFFPLNTHLAFYSSYWAQAVWWLIALYVSAFGVAARAVPAPGGAGEERR